MASSVEIPMQTSTLTSLVTFALAKTRNTAISTLLATLSMLASFILLIQILHRSIFHQLRSIPGPWINSVSEIPATIALVTGNQHVYYRWLHEKYGPVIRVSPNELSFVSVQAREEIYGLRKGGLNMEKSPIFLGAVGNVDGQTGVSLALNEDHSRQRKALGYLFTNSALIQHESLMRIHINKLVAVLKQKTYKKESVDFSSWYTYFAFDVMGELCFAEPFGCLDQASVTEWSTSVINVFIAAAWTQGIRRLSGVGTWLESFLIKLLVPAKAVEWRKIHLENSRQKTLARLSSGNRDHPDFLCQIMVKNEMKKSLSQTEIVLNMALFISAGTDTTATALTGWTYYVCTHPDVYKRLTNEVRDAFHSTEDIKWENVRNLRYLEATLNEAIRLFPPSAASQQRIVPAGGATIDGYYVPAGKTVAVSPWAATRSSLNFHEPDLFRPERWLGQSTEYSNDHLNASLPFGTGPRVCIGKNLAYMEMRLVTAHLLWHFDIKLDLTEHRDKNEAWGLNGRMKPVKVFHSTMKPDLWITLQPLEHVDNQ